MLTHTGIKEIEIEQIAPRPFKNDDGGDMSIPCGILIFGASGSGTTTIGRELARLLDCTHIEIDDIFWQKTDPPFQTPVPLEQRKRDLLAAAQKAGRFVASGSACGWDEAILPFLRLGVFVQTATAIRIERLKKREYNDFGERILPGGDMYENHTEFLEWVAKYDDGGADMRSHALHEKWIEAAPCPILRVDGTRDVHDTAREIAGQAQLTVDK
ncbi:MAG: AAA family ATPase [Oscillospiraceae bacterium]|nr:AAA family ATPase [Oscillospiraceae bacterium]